MNKMHLDPATSAWLERFARFGLITKGMVYLLSGLLVLLAALHIRSGSSSDADKSGVLNYIYRLPMGTVILSVITLGLFCYAAWRLIQGFRDTEHKGKDLKGIGKRIAYISSGLIYGSVALYSGSVVINNQTQNSDSKQKMAANLLDLPFGQYLVYAAAIIMFLSGLNQLYRALSGKYKKHVEHQQYRQKYATNILIKAGIIGYISRAAIWLLIGWLFLQAGINASASKAGNSGSALQLLQTWRFGNIYLQIIAIGLILYGLFLFIRARYQPIRIE